MWRKRLALRNGISEDMSGLYTVDEIGPDSGGRDPVRIPVADSDTGEIVDAELVSETPPIDVRVPDAPFVPANGSAKATVKQLNAIRKLMRGSDS